MARGHRHQGADPAAADLRHLDATGLRHRATGATAQPGGDLRQGHAVTDPYPDASTQAQPNAFIYAMRRRDLVQYYLPAAAGSITDSSSHSTASHPDVAADPHTDALGVPVGRASCEVAMTDHYPFKLNLQHRKDDPRKNVLHRNPRSENCHAPEDGVMLDAAAGLEVIKNQTARYCSACFPLVSDQANSAGAESENDASQP